MDLEIIREYCLKKKGVTESLPFNEDSPVYKVMSKIFLIANLTPPVSINLKCDPEKAVELREKYSAVLPGYHMNKLHWNTIMLDDSIHDKLILTWIDDSYCLVAEGLTKKEKVRLKK
ncbi:MAG: MmcQ/YjbR family DNA-binding protein [Bacteroidetes bacterium]|nr:MmcQ/YjbR family DNA-binding protein [Bacteroidota bacterium]